MSYFSYPSYLNSILFKPRFVNHYPVHLNIEPTTACNLTCQTCSHKHFIENPSFLKFGIFKSIIDECRPKKVSLNGLGETFLNKNIFEMIEYAKSKNIDLVTSTNGTFLERDAKNILSSPLSTLRISLDATNSEIYKIIRGSDKFDQIINGIQLINKLKKERNANITLRLEYVIQNDNLNFLKEFVSLSEILEIKYINFQVICNPIDPTDDFRKDLVNKFQRTLFINKLQEALIFAKQLKIKNNLQNLVSNFNIVWKCYQTIKRPNLNLSHKCIQPWISAMVTADGWLSLCCKIRSQDMFAGNIIEKDLFHVWNNEKFMKFRQNLKKSKNVHFFCKDCIPLTKYDLINS